MILNFNKLFPNSCAAQGIINLRVNYEDIESFGRELIDSTGDENRQEDIVTLKNGESYHFPCIDTGIFILASIQSAREILTEFEATKLSIAGLSQEYIQHKQRTALNYLQEIGSIYS